MLIRSGRKKLMANRRMFSKEITNSSEFQMMSPSAQALYFHIGMNADDDGFCEVFTIVRMTESKPDDLRALHERGFVFLVDSKVGIVKDWHTNNDIRSDRYTPSKYLCESKYSDVYRTIMQDKIKHLSRYKTLPVPFGLGITNGITNGITQDRIGQDISGANAPISFKGEEEPKPKETRSKDKEAIYRLFSAKEQPWWRHKQQKAAAIALFDMVGVEAVRTGLKVMAEHVDDVYCPQAATPFEYTAKREALKRYIKRNGI